MVKDLGGCRAWKRGRAAALVAFGLMLAAACQPVRPVAELGAGTTVTQPTPAADSPASAPAAEPITATVEITSGTGLTTSTSPAAPVAAEAADDPALIAAGLEVYHKQYCGVCHTLAAAQTTGTFGPAHDGLGTTAAQRIQDPQYHGEATTAAEYIRESILDPTAYTVPGFATSSHRMPAYTHLEGETIDALVAFLAAQK